MTYDLTGKRIWVAGHRGMVGGAVVRRLGSEGCEVITAGRDVVDLVNQKAVHDWMAATKPDAIILAAAKVGGIHANATYPVDFLYENLTIEANILHAAHEADVERLLFLGSSCIYPKFANQPIQEGSLLTGALEPTNEWYAIAKIAGLKLVQAYRKQHGRDWISAMPTNLYGPGDNYDLTTSHVLPALLRKFHEAKERGDKEVVVWSSDLQSDCAALGHLMEATCAAVPVRACRDATRGGIASALNEMAEAAGCAIEIDEAALPLRAEVKGTCEILGLDPLYLANEGTLVLFVPAEQADAALAAMRSVDTGKGATIIGRAKEGAPMVTMRTAFGGSRIVDMLVGEQLPRIC